MMNSHMAQKTSLLGFSSETGQDPYTSRETADLPKGLSERFIVVSATGVVKWCVRVYSSACSGFLTKLRSV